jgi:hypothetical protein
MRLLGDLERLLAQERSLFRAQLLREDLARLRKLRELAAAAADAAAFAKAGARIGWTQGDARTHELREPLERLLEAVYAFERGKRDEAQEARIVESWDALHRARMEKLVGCLSTPVPKPAD